jgi:hypothetical protein
MANKGGAPACVNEMTARINHYAISYGNRHAQFSRIWGMKKYFGKRILVAKPWLAGLSSAVRTYSRC